MKLIQFGNILNSWFIIIFNCILFFNIIICTFNLITFVNLRHIFTIILNLNKNLTVFRILTLSKNLFNHRFPSILILLYLHVNLLKWAPRIIHTIPIFFAIADGNLFITALQFGDYLIFIFMSWLCEISIQYILFNNIYLLLAFNDICSWFIVILI